MATGVYPKIPRKEIKISKDSPANAFFKRRCVCIIRFSSLAPGVSVGLKKHVLLIFCERSIWPVSDNIARLQMLVSPLAQIDFVLGNSTNSKN